MKSLKYIWILCLSCLAAGLTSCNEEDKYFDSKYQSTKIVVDQIYLEDYESSVHERPVTFARLGQLIRIEGSGLYGMKKVYINGYETYFNRAYVTDQSMLIQINSKTLPKDKEKVTVYGTGLQETTKVTLPGGIEITADIESDEDGEWYSFIMPENYSGSGSIYSEGANGQAATPAYFNFADCMILDFDGNGSQGFWSWSETD